MSDFREINDSLIWDEVKSKNQVKTCYLRVDRNRKKKKKKMSLETGTSLRRQVGIIPVLTGALRLFTIASYSRLIAL